MYYSDSPERDFDRWDAEQNRQLERLPICCECDRPIQDDYFYEFNDDYICEECLRDNHKKAIEDYIE